MPTETPNHITQKWWLNSSFVNHCQQLLVYTRSSLSISIPSHWNRILSYSLLLFSPLSCSALSMGSRFPKTSPCRCQFSASDAALNPNTQADPAASQSTRRRSNTYKRAIRELEKNDSFIQSYVSRIIPWKCEGHSFSRDRKAALTDEENIMAIYVVDLTNQPRNVLNENREHICDNLSGGDRAQPTWKKTTHRPPRRCAFVDDDDFCLSASSYRFLYLLCLLSLCDSVHSEV